MKTQLSARLAWFTGSLLAAAQISSAQIAAPSSLPNLDMRAPLSAVLAAPEKAAALERLRQVAPGVKVEFEPVSGAPKLVSSPDGFLTGKAGKGATISTQNLGAFSVADPHRVTKAFLNEHRLLFGHGAEALTNARIRRDDLTAHNGLHTMIWEQQVDGVPLFEGTLISHTTRYGELVSVSSQFIANPEAAAANGTPDRAALLGAPIVSARQAVALAARNVGEKIEAEAVTPSGSAKGDAERRQKFSASVLKGEADAKLIWLPMDKNSLRLCWDVVMMSRQRGEMFRTLVDARTGDVLVRRCLTSYISDASYRVWTSDSPSPFSPGWPTPTNLQPAVVARTLVTLPAMDTNASPAGWIPDGGNQTWGNNVDAHTDRNSDDVADLPRPQGSPFRVFDFAMDLNTQDPTNYASASVVQLFYLCNWYHDKLYSLGFTEAAGNFQSNNFSRGGTGNDAVQADALDGGGTDNANFSTPPDGTAGRMQMYVFSGPTPRRDGDLDAEIVFHEHTHGLSWRLVGGGQVLGDTQSDGMGEGWSDFYAIALLSEAADNVNGNFAAGGYATFQLSVLTQNYYYGIRRYPYTTDLAKNPLTFKDIDPAQASSHAGIPRSPIIPTTANEVHNEGEVWCATLNEARVSLINKYGWAVGNQLMLQLTTDGMKLTVPHPNFLQARDAIIQADVVNSGGTNRNELWAAFAKRGMGYTATSPVSSTTTGLHEAFDVPDDLRLIPATGFVSTGGMGGPFTVTAQSILLTNTGAASLNWTLGNTSLWLNAAPASGTLAASATTVVNFTLNNVASNLVAGFYNSTVLFTNTTSGVVQGVPFALTVLGAPIITLQPTNRSVVVGGSTTFSAGVIGLAPLAYQWRFNTTNLINATNLYLTLSSITISQAGNYSLFISNNLGSTNSINALLTVLVPPPNDLCSGAILISGSTYTSTQSTVLATSTGDPLPTCVGTSFGKGIWYSYTPVANGTMIVDTVNSTYDTVLGVYTGTCGALTQIGCNDDSAFGLTSHTTNAVTAGTTYLILAGGFASATGSLVLHLNYTASGPTPPVITSQPASQTAAIGANTAFSVTATGTAPLSYQWKFNNTNLLGATNSLLSLANVQPSQAGNYKVTITNPVSSAVSSNAVLTVQTTLVCYPPPSGLVSWWPGEGNVSDIIGTNTGTLSATGAAYANAMVGQGFRFDGTNGYASIPDAPALKPVNVTCEAWAWLDPDASPGTEQIIFKRNSRTFLFEGYSLAKEHADIGGGTFVDRFLFMVASSGGTQVIARSVTLAQRGVWYHVAGTYDGSTVRLFVNGLAEASVFAGFPLDYGTRPVFIGTSGEAPPYDSMFAGIIDEPSIYSRVLSTNEVAAIYNAGSAGKCIASACVPPPAGLAGWWPGEGNLNDSSGGNSGSAVGTIRYTNALVGQGMVFDGTSYVTIPAAPTLDIGATGSGVTIESWIKPGGSGQGMPVAEWYSTTIGLHLWVESNYRLFANVIDTSNVSHTLITAIGALNTNSFQHVALAYDKASGLAALYVNGVQIVVQNIGTVTPMTASALNLGSRATTGEKYTGMIDELSIYNRALSTTEIAAIYNAGVAGKCPVITASLVITNQPASQTVAVGGTASFTIGASGTPPPHYNWKRNGAFILGATNATYSTNNVQLSDSGGQFSCLVSNAAGTLLSSNATLTVQLPFNGRFAILGAPGTESWNLDVQAKIQAANPAAMVDILSINPGNPNPTLAQLQAYSAVIAYTDNFPDDSAGLGDVLADYVDAGGGVVVATFGFDSSIGIGGRLLNDGYLPLSPGFQSGGVELTLVADLPLHDILADVASFDGGDNSYHELATLESDAVLVAHWSDGVPLVATKITGTGRVVGLNFYPPSESARNDFWRTNSSGGTLMANSLAWAGNSNLVINSNSVFNFESGLQGFVLNNNLGSSNGLWHVSSGRGYDFGHSSSNSLYYGQNETVAGGGNYDLGIKNGGAAISPNIALPNATPLILSYNYLMAVESPASFDQAWVEISTNSGTSYTILARKNVIGGLTNNTGGLWINNTLNVSAYAGTTVKLRFRFDTFDALGNTTEGWYLDDITISVQSSNAPAIVLQPISQSVAEGGTAAFNVGATGIDPLSYFWKRNGSFIDGATNSNYFTNNVRLSDSGSQFSCLVSNAYGTVNSSAALLTVTGIPPIIVTQPAGGLIPSGAGVTLGVGVGGSSPFSYQWLHSGTNLPGATGSNYHIATITPEMGGAYWMVVTNAFGSATSSNAVLTVLMASSTNDFILNGRYVSLPVSTNGQLISTRLAQGGKFNPAGTGGTNGADFWQPGASVYNYVIGVNGINYPNGAFTTLTVSNLSSPTLLHALISGTVAGPVIFTRDISFGINDRLVKIADTIQNFGLSAIPNVVTLDTLNPEQGYDGTAAGTYFTYNNVINVATTNDAVVATATNNNLSLLLGSESGLALPSAIGLNNMDAYGYQTVVDPNGAADDISINLAQNYGTLSAGQSRRAVWFMAFGNSFGDVTNVYGAGIAPKLVLTPISLQNCVFSFSLNGPAGSNFVLQASSNLSSWSGIVTYSLPASGSLVFIDPNACNAAPRFYRARFSAAPGITSWQTGTQTNSSDFTVTNNVILLPANKSF